MEEISRNELTFLLFIFSIYVLTRSYLAGITILISIFLIQDLKYLKRFRERMENLLDSDLDKYKISTAALIISLVLVLSTGLENKFLLENRQPNTNKDPKEDYVPEETYNELNNKYKSIKANYTKIYENYERLKGAVSSYENIPETPAVSGLSYKMYGEENESFNQLAISYPNMSVTGLRGTGSMSPGISSQNMIITTSTFNRKTLSPGQIVGYRIDGSEQVILHRIHKVNNSEGFCYIMKGDANLYRDGECVDPKQIEYLALGVLFRGTSNGSFCEKDLDYGPESRYCPS